MSAGGASALLEVRDLETSFVTDLGVVKAVDGVSFTIEREQILGLVGETGSGKSVTAASILRLVQPPGRIVRGEVLFEGEDLLRKSEAEMARLRGGAIALVVQNVKASLNPLLPVGKQIANVYATHLGLSRKRARAFVLEMLEAVGFSDPGRVARSYPHQLSGGMAQRTLLALVLGTSPNLLIADEPTSGLDATVQVEVLDLMTSLVRERRASALLITHDFGIVARYCQRVAVMYAGRIVEIADVDRFLAAPAHPYSARLLAALGWRSGMEDALAAAAGDLDVRDLSAGCPYRPRCALATSVCAAETPELREVASDHWARCHRSEKLAEVIGADGAARGR